MRSSATREERLLSEISGGRNTIEALGAVLYPKLTSPRMLAMGQNQVRSMVRKLVTEGKVPEAEDGTFAVAG